MSDRVRVEVDVASCCASGRCAATEPAVFAQDPVDGTVELLDAEPPAALTESVLLCADLCPCTAITVHELP